MMPPTRLLEIILGLAIGISRQVLVVASGACGSSALLRLLVAHSNLEQCQDTAPRFLGQCQHTDLSGLSWASLRRPVGTWGQCAVGCEWRPPPLLPKCLHSLSQRC